MKIKIRVFILKLILTQTPNAAQNGAKFDRSLFCRKTWMIYVGQLPLTKLLGTLIPFFPLRRVLHTPCLEIWHGQLHMYFSGLKENLCSCSHLKSQALNFGTRSMKYIVHGLSYVDIILKKIRDMKCEEYCHVTSLETYSRANFRTTYRVVGTECNIRKSLEATKKIT